MSKRKTIIIGGGPAGLTAAYELAKNSDIQPIVLECEELLGGISKTVNYKGNRIDIGGHRFFSKSDVVMKWWQDIMPISDDERAEKEDEVMLVRERISRIYFLRKFFNYPISLSLDTVKNLGLVRFFKMGVSYVWIRLFPIRNECSLEDFYINRFGGELYRTFFRDYTEKVWGVKCCEISPEWGRQRVKGLSVWKAIVHALKWNKGGDLEQKNTETSLIERFSYPKLGPGQLWECVAEKIKEMGGEIHMGCEVVKIITDGANIKAVEAVDAQGGREIYEGSDFISTMPIKDLIAALECQVPEDVAQVASNLVYRDFMTAGLLLNRMDMGDSDKLCHPDTWLYIQESDVKLGRVQIFNNWSPYLVAQKDKVWIGLEYFVNEGDELWTMPDAEFIQMAIKELEQISLIKGEDVIDSTLLRVKKAYPSYFGTYYELDKVVDYVSGFENLYLAGRNGMHKYNNQDHSMLTAMKCAEIISGKGGDKKDIWSINTEQEYHESK